MQRLRTDSRFALVILFSVAAVAGITPFAVYRLVTGQILLGLVDLGVMLFIAGTAVYALRGGNTDRAALVAACTSSIGSVFVTQLIGLSGLLWTYPVLLANFLLLGRTRAVFLCAISIGALAVIEAPRMGALDTSLFVITALVVSVLAYTFAYRTEIQHRQLEILATHDPLTGASNRRDMDAALKAAIDAYASHGVPACLVVLDVDHFKCINDSFGHERGDAVLVQLADLVRRSTRRDDRFFRTGGEEFALLLPGVAAHVPARIAEELRAGVERTLRCNDHAVTVSIGTAQLRDDDTTTRWLARADAAMYRAKHEGRNRVVADRPPEAVDAAGRPDEGGGILLRPGTRAG